MIFQSSSPSDQVSGASIRAYVNALGLSRRRGLQLLAEQGITDPEPDGWYPWQAYLNAQRAIYAGIGPNTVARIGRTLVEEASFGSEIQTIDDALSTLDRDYRLRHRGKQVGGFTWEPAAERGGRVTIRNPYPCELDRQVVESLCRRFKPADSLTVYVRHEGRCRNDGADGCVLDIRW